MTASLLGLRRFAGPFCLAGLSVAIVLGAGGPHSLKAEDDDAEDAKKTVPGVPLAVAKDRAQLMHKVYLSTLDVIHRQYFHGDRAMVPARAMEDIFRDMKRESQMETRWISVNLRAMSIDHTPETEFEKRAAKEIGAGKEAIETIESGYYRRAARVSLSGGCIGCHEGFSMNRSTRRKFAGLVISIPLETEAVGLAKPGSAKSAPDNSVPDNSVPGKSVPGNSVPGGKSEAK